MKKAPSKRVRNPSAASLAELPELDLDAFTPHSNRWAARIAHEGIEIVHDGPSPESLEQIPEVAFTRSARPNPYAERLASELHRLRVGRGRPRAGEQVGETVPRSIRLPRAIWEALEAEAAAKHLTVHAVLRAAVASYLQSRLGTSGHGKRTKKRRP